MSSDNSFAAGEVSCRCDADSFGTEVTELILAVVVSIRSNCDTIQDADVVRDVTERDDGGCTATKALVVLTVVPKMTDNNIPVAIIIIVARIHICRIVYCALL